MNTAIPIFKEQNASFLRQEKEGFALLISRAHPEARELVINDTTQQIAHLCDGKRSIADVADQLKRKYPMVPQEQLQRDVQQVLGSLSRLGFVEWSTENPYLFRRDEAIDAEYSLRVGFEEDLGQLLEFLRGARLFELPAAPARPDCVSYLSPLVNGLEYDELPLRQKLFSFGEQFFFLVKADRIEGLVSFVTPARPVESASLRLMAAPAEFAPALLRYGLDQLPYLTVNPVAKVKLHELLSTVDANDRFLALARELGFQDEGTARNELGFEKDVRFWARSYQPQHVAFARSKRRELGNGQ